MTVRAARCRSAGRRWAAVAGAGVGALVLTVSLAQGATAAETYTEGVQAGFVTSADAQATTDVQATAAAPTGWTRRTATGPTTLGSAEQANLAWSMAVPAVVPWPAECLNLPIWSIIAKRTWSCRATPLTIPITRVDKNGIKRGYVTGKILDYKYADPRSTEVIHQVAYDVTDTKEPTEGWHLRMTLDRAVGCSLMAQRFDTQTLVKGGVATGVARLRTAAGAGQSQNCISQWRLHSGPSGAVGSVDRTMLWFSYGETRCDNAISGRRPGCVVPWAPEPVVYRLAGFPEIGKHITRAQQAGLPGAEGRTPLHRLTNQTFDDRNRERACGDIAAVGTRTCDEYPFAATHEGLYTTFPNLTVAQTRQYRFTFADCSISTTQVPLTPAASRRLSVCMAPAAEQSRQGALMRNFNADWRMFDNDPFYVKVA